MPTLKCADVQRALFETFDDQDAAVVDLAAHLERCPHCAHIVAEARARARELDVTLAAVLAPPRLSPSFRRALYQRIEPAAPSTKSDALPDILHLASCAILTAVSAAMLPEYAPVIVAAGTIATVMSHLMLVVMRNTLDESAL